MFAEVAVARVSRQTDKIYHYRIPEELVSQVQVGSQVLVPFGRSKVSGYVVGLLAESSYPQIKNIIALTSAQPFFSAQQIALAKWVAEYYGSFFISALRLVMPPGTKKLERRTSNIERRKQDKEIPTSNIKIQNKSQLQNPKSQIKLTEDQQKALGQIVSAIDKQQVEKFLLYGITGSGKTEVYIQAIDYILGRGRCAIVLVPEIGLTPQLVQRFGERFGEIIAVLHSALTIKQRNLAWERIAAGEAKIVLGTRSAIFAPVKDLGLIVIDEEYEVTYKSEKNPRYHTREVALKLAELNKAVVVMGSATPAVETYYKAEKGEYQKLVLPKRIDERPLPPVEVVDMREEKDRILSRILREELKEVLSRGEQAILFINRRGFFTFVICQECGMGLTCPQCSVSLSFHAGDHQLHCNGCGYTSTTPVICPRCQSAAIRYLGAGTQRIEKEVAQVFPAARILRYDRDSVSQRAVPAGRQGMHAQFFATFAEGKADVLIGTQMVTKGLDVANVTLVGVVAVDTALNLPDFRAAEHTFQMITQVAGRAGRHHLPGKVIIQTYAPQHYAIQAAAKHDYESFYQQEIKYRQELDYPPFSRLIGLIINAKSEEKAAKFSEEISHFLKRRLASQVFGPAPAAIAKLRGEFRYRLLLKGPDTVKMYRAVSDTLDKMVIPREVRLAVDVDPMNML